MPNATIILILGGKSTNETLAFTAITVNTLKLHIYNYPLSPKVKRVTCFKQHMLMPHMYDAQQFTCSLQNMFLSKRKNLNFSWSRLNLSTWEKEWWEELNGKEINAAAEIVIDFNILKTSVLHVYKNANFKHTHHVISSCCRNA